MSDVDFAAYNSGNVMILEYPKPYFWMLVVLLFLSFIGIPLALYTTSIYETEGNKQGIDWHNRGVSYSTFTILGILSLLILVFLGYSIYNRAKRNIIDSNDKLQEQAAKIYAHAYGEKAKQLAIGAGGEKLEGFKTAMYQSLKNAFKSSYVNKTGEKYINTGETFDDGKKVGEAAVNDVADALRDSSGQKALTSNVENTPSGQKALTPGGENTPPEQKALTPDVENNKAVEVDSPISLSRASRRRKSPSSLKKKKKKASPSSKKKKASPTKKKSTSSRRK